MATARPPWRTLSLVMASLLLVTGCGAPKGGAPSSAAHEETTAIGAKVYLLRDGYLAPVRRQLVIVDTFEATALASLLKGPGPAEAAAGFTSTIPSQTKLLGLSVSGGAATVDFNAAFGSGGGSFSVISRLAEVTYTLTQFPEVSRVVFELDGEPGTVFSGEGLVLDEPSTRESFGSVLPQVFLESPVYGDRVSSPLALKGTANTFEAVFHARLSGPDGQVLSDRQVTASSGTGRRGAFEDTLTFPGSASGSGTLVIYVHSAKDGSEVPVLSLPVTLVKPTGP